jgi:hypothetical protein
MSLNNPESKLKDLIVVEKGLIPKDICDHVIQTIEKRDWAPHTWYNAQAGTFGSEATMELDVQNTTEELQALLTPYVIAAGASYNEKAHYNCERTKQIMYKFSKIRFNRYSPGQIMRKHHDHIATLFSPPEQGIPVLSFIGNLNDDYEGDLVTRRAIIYTLSFSTRIRYYRGIGKSKQILQTEVDYSENVDPTTHKFETQKIVGTTTSDGAGGFKEPYTETINFFDTDV